MAARAKTDAAAGSVGIVETRFLDLPGPLELDCGPRDEVAAAPRGEYIQVVLDESVWGTRCGDGSPFAFWLRLAPEGEPVENVVVGMQGGGVCIFAEDCSTRPADLFEAMNDQPLPTGTMSNASSCTSTSSASCTTRWLAALLS